ncbi:Phosphoserine aminotransferase [Aphelenchoides bicaudatus]|nr:Phosphoserine aminotransferase [Aphelenchoides bicaudatus]
MGKKINFGPGPAKLPEKVLEKAQKELLDYDGLGLSVLEMSHRSADFAKIINDAEALLRELMQIPDNYEVLFMHGGGTGQFAAVPLNLSFLSKNKETPEADYLVTGTWSQKAAKEAEKYLKVNKVANLEKYTTAPPTNEWKLSNNAAYLYYCANETIHGVEIADLSGLPENVNLIADISSNILSNLIDISKHIAIVAGTQKNLGIGGLTLVIIRKDLIGHEQKSTPGILSYASISSNKSLYNTPCVFAIYITKLVLEWIKEEGGVQEMYERSKKKSDLIYNLIDNSNGFYQSPVTKQHRSRMNIPFRIKENAELEAKFLKEATAKGMISLKGKHNIVLKLTSLRWWHSCFTVQRREPRRNSKVGRFPRRIPQKQRIMK